MVFVFNPFTGTLDNIIKDHGELDGLTDNDHIQYVNAVASAPLTLSSQSITFNYDTDYFQLSGNNLQIKDIYVRNTGDQINGTLTIDETNTSAFIVRRDSEGTIIFTVDTANQTVNIFGEQHVYNHIYAEDDPMYLYDTSDNELLAFDTVASAINYLSFANGSLGNGPEINALGDDTNIDIELIPKGTGGIVCGGSGVSIFQEAIVINEGGNDQDTRIEGDTDANLFYIDAGNNRVGIGMSNPAQKFDVTGNINLSGELMGCRCLLPFNRTSITADAYLGAAAMAFTSTTGYLMHRAGSIVGISIVTTTTDTSSGTIICHAYKNGASVYSVTITTTGSGTYEASGTQARGTDTFVAGDTIVAYVDFGTFTGTAAPVGAIIEVVFDT